MPELTTSQRAWRRQAGNVSLPEVHRSVVVPVTASFWRKLLAFSGPGFLVAVGYMDPGNWATDLAGGARFGYALLMVVMISNFMAILLQHLCIKLGVATGRDLAQACRDHYSTPTVGHLWILCEIAIAACDLAEVVGSAIALATSLWHSAGLGMRHYRARRARCALSSEQRFPLHRSAGHHAHRDDRHLFRDRVDFLQTKHRRRCSRICPRPAHYPEPGDALRQHRYPRRDGDAA